MQGFIRLIINQSAYLLLTECHLVIYKTIYFLMEYFQLILWAYPVLLAQFRDPLKLALQSGPILKENNEFKNLSIIDDHPARRIVMGVTGENKAVLMVIYKDGSSFDGPLLGNLPTVLKTFEEKSGTTLADAINLDGGGASAFYSGDTILTEASPVGSFFCQHE